MLHEFLHLLAVSHREPTAVRLKDLGVGVHIRVRKSGKDIVEFLDACVEAVRLLHELHSSRVAPVYGDAHFVSFSLLFELRRRNG